MAIDLTLVRTEDDKRKFYNFAWQVYRQDKNWVPHLWPQRKSYLDHKAAFFTYGQGDFWIAKQADEIVGTLGMAIDPSRNEFRRQKAAIFGFFEVLPNGYEVACAMWDFACKWACDHGMNELLGPYSFAMNDDPGFLIEGFDCSPAIMMGHNPPYYSAFADRYGFKPNHDGLAYRYDLDSIHFDINNGPDIIKKIATRAQQRHGDAVIRIPSMKDWDFEVIRLHQVYNKSLSVLPDYSPLELAEFRSQADSLKSVIDPELVFIAEVKDKPVGFSLGLPNINEALIHANGLRYPWDYLKAIIAQRNILSASFKILAIDPDYWGYGLDALMYLEMGKALIRKGYTWIDASLTGEDNPQTNKLATRLGAYPYRRYREYRLSL